MSIKIAEKINKTLPKFLSEFELNKDTMRGIIPCGEGSFVWEYKQSNPHEHLVRQGVSQPVQTAGSKPIDFQYHLMGKDKKNEIIHGAIDNMMNPKRDVTFEQADWLRFTSYLRKKGWRITKI